MEQKGKSAIAGVHAEADPDRFHSPSSLTNQHEMLYSSKMPSHPFRER